MLRIWPDPVVLDADAVRDAYAPDRAHPSVRLNFVTSLDGAVEVDGYSKGLSGEADVRVFGLLRMHSDAVMVGAGTLRHEGYHALRLDEARRSWRREQGLPVHPTLVIVSASLRVDPGDDVFAEAPVRPVVLTHAAAPAERRHALAKAADVIACGESVVDLAAGLRELHGRGLSQVLCEGGPHLFGALLAADLVDELCLTLSPLLAGPGAGRIVAGAPVDTPRPMRLVHILTEGDMLLTRYARA
jgi:riboflavin-specific deaminase-like protein